MAVTSPTQICNLALMRLGADTIADIDESSTNAGYCKFVYDRCVNWLLRKHDWSFALKRETMAESSGTNLTAYTYSYQMPTGVARFMALLDEDGNVSLEPYMIENDQIYTEQEDAMAKFIDENVDVKRYDEAFVHVLSLMIAWQIAMRITQSNDIRKEIYQEFRGELREAMGMDAKEASSPEAEPTQWTTIH